jgi:hypothetical protein
MTKNDNLENMAEEVDENKTEKENSPSLTAIALDCVEAIAYSGLGLRVSNLAAGMIGPLMPTTGQKMYQVYEQLHGRYTWRYHRHDDASRLFAFIGAFGMVMMYGTAAVEFSRTLESNLPYFTVLGTWALDALVHGVLGTELEER